jgi:copper(I)-binding protein
LILETIMQPRSLLIFLATAIPMVSSAFAQAPQAPTAPAPHASMAAGVEAGSEVRIGDIVITGAFARATLPRAPVGGGFLALSNTGSSDDRLVSASAPVGRETQIHEMAVVNDVMRMRQIGDGIALPAGQSVTLAPGGLHLMFMGLNQPLVEGESFPVTLTFEKAGAITLDMVVAGSAAGAMTMDHNAPTPANSQGRM